MKDTFANWAAVVAYAREAWGLDGEGDDWFEHQWQWDDRSQLVTFSRVEFGGEVWIGWASAIADEAGLSAERVLELTGGEVARIVCEEGCWWLEQHLPLALLTPALLERYSDSFAERADRLELELTGRDRD